MLDPRNTKLADLLINYSTEMKPGQKILIEVTGEATELVAEIVKTAYKAGALPYIAVNEPQLSRVLFSEATETQFKDMARWEVARMKEMDAYISIRAGMNVSEMSAVPHERMKLHSEHYYKPLHIDLRVEHTNWCVLRYPNPSMAQLANMCTEHFEDLYYRVCTLDYAKMSRAMDNLANVIKNTDRVRITAKDTDLTFSIKGLPPIKCDGKRNIPDGEVYTAPVKESVNGFITYNVPAVYQGVTYDNIRFEFKDGKIIKAISNETDRLNQLLDTDEGARYIGEFSLGLNPYIEKPMKDALFDEKIKGSLHFTPGNAYGECDNGNRSSVHWDLVLIQRPEYGGGTIEFDGRTIRKDGLFVIPELECLNPEQLK